VSEPIEDDLNREEKRGLLRRRDQRFLAGLTVIAGLAVFGWWWHSGGPSGRLTEWHETPSQSTCFEVNVNTAPWPELTQLPEIGETLARRIVENRQTEGPFNSPRDLIRVHGIGEKTLGHMRPYLSPDSWPLDASDGTPREPSPGQGSGGAGR
jgi:competence protein ComEA